jgi:hypothetical protein
MPLVDKISRAAGLGSGIQNVRNVSRLRKMTGCTCKMCSACLLNVDNVNTRANADLLLYRLGSTRTLKWIG